MKKSQLVNMIIRPTLKEIPHGFTEEAQLAITMIIAHESQRGEYIHQVGGGPALGMIQMEPTTYRSTWKYGASIWDNALALGIINNKQFRNMTPPPVERLLYDLRFNVFMARQRLFMKSAALPTGGTTDMSAYLKRHWNSVGGAADNMSYHRDYINWSD